MDFSLLLVPFDSLTVEYPYSDSTAGRMVKTGLIASVIISQWTWAATLLQSSNVAWRYGVSGPFWYVMGAQCLETSCGDALDLWISRVQCIMLTLDLWSYPSRYASGASIQVLLFGVLAIRIKKVAPSAHTVCEIVKARWGTPAHLTFLCFCFAANIIVTSMLLLGGAATVEALTGMDYRLASFLIPWGIILYTAAGGLLSVYLSSYLHTVRAPCRLQLWRLFRNRRSFSKSATFHRATLSRRSSFTQC
jgi:urea-proton symporter